MSTDKPSDGKPKPKPSPPPPPPPKVDPELIGKEHKRVPNQPKEPRESGKEKKRKEKKRKEKKRKEKTREQHNVSINAAL